MARRFSLRQRRILALVAAGQCQQCNRRLTKSFHADHVTPFSKGGATVLKNGQALCPNCNQKKGVNE